MAKMRYVIQADYENGETLFVARGRNPPTLNIDEARVFLTKQIAESVAKAKNEYTSGLTWEVAEY
jgi:hypothetical protein